MFTVVPGHFVIFRSPAATPCGRLWIDEGGERRFSATFYAELLHDLGVTQVCRRRGMAVWPRNDLV